ncbi:unnamed protein product [Aphanomyces euteiches]|uniref:Uncharacterized protein n=1 Tax=Aphanomyces euteiches TaxID=100861 RepID=A0A6G0X4Q1_9STRA|nr:hypothetical protein Ae201684_008587 [Aphanomyces euteiches]
MESRRPMPRAMTDWKDDGLDERFVASAKKYSMSTSYSRDLYPPRQPNDDYDKTNYSARTAYEAPPASTLTYDSPTLQRRVSPRDLPTERNTATQDDRIQRPSSKYSLVSSFDLPSSYSNGRVQDLSEQQREPAEEYKTATRAPTETYKTHVRGERTPPGPPSEHHYAPTPEDGMYAPPRQSFHGSYELDKERYGGRSRNLNQNAKHELPQRSSQPTPPQSKMSPPRRPPHDTTSVEEVKRLVQSAFDAIHNMKANHEELLDFTKMHFDENTASRAVESVDNVVQALTEVRKRFRQLCQDTPAQKQTSEEKVSSLARDEGLNDMAYKYSACSTTESAFTNNRSSERPIPKESSRPSASKTTDYSAKTPVAEYKPSKLTSSSGRNMFAEFDRKMQEIRNSLNAIASREAMALPTLKPRQSGGPPSTSKSSSSSFDEYMKTFKSDLANLSPNNYDNPAMDTSPLKPHRDKLDFDFITREPYSTP